MRWFNKNWKPFPNNIKFVVGKREKKLRLWYDHRIDEGPLKDILLNILYVVSLKKANTMDILKRIMMELGRISLSFETSMINCQVIPFWLSQATTTVMRIILDYFPCKQVLKTKASPCIAFFAYEAARCRILTSNNLMKKGRLLAKRCFLMYEQGGIPCIFSFGVLRLEDYEIQHFPFSASIR